MTDSPIIDDTFAEAFTMRGTRLIITAVDEELARVAAREFSGNSSSVIGCDCEAGIEGIVPESETPDGRPGVSVLAFAFDTKSLQAAITSRVGQNVLTCPTTACFAGLDSEEKTRQYDDRHHPRAVLPSRRKRLRQAFQCLRTFSVETFRIPPALRTIFIS